MSKNSNKIYYFNERARGNNLKQEITLRLISSLRKAMTKDVAALIMNPV